MYSQESRKFSNSIYFQSDEKGSSHASSTLPAHAETEQQASAAEVVVKEEKEKQKPSPKIIISDSSNSFTALEIIRGLKFLNPDLPVNHIDELWGNCDSPQEFIEKLEKFVKENPDVLFVVNIFFDVISEYSRAEITFGKMMFSQYDLIDILEGLGVKYRCVGNMKIDPIPNKYKNLAQNLDIGSYFSYNSSSRNIANTLYGSLPSSPLKETKEAVKKADPKIVLIEYSGATREDSTLLYLLEYDKFNYAKHFIWMLENKGFSKPKKRVKEIVHYFDRESDSIESLSAEGTFFAVCFDFNKEAPEAAARPKFDEMVELCRKIIASGNRLVILMKDPNYDRLRDSYSPNKEKVNYLPIDLHQHSFHELEPLNREITLLYQYLKILISHLPVQEPESSKKKTRTKKKK